MQHAITKYLNVLICNSLNVTIPNSFEDGDDLQFQYHTARHESHEKSCATRVRAFAVLPFGKWPSKSSHAPDLLPEKTGGYQ